VSFARHVLRDCMCLRATFLHVRKRVLGQSKHLENIASEHALCHLEINLLEVGAHGLFGGVVYEDVDGSVSVVIV